MDEGTRVIFTGPQYGIDLVLENYATQMPLHSGIKSNSMVEWRALNFYQTFNKYIGHWSNGTCEWNCCKIKVQGKYRFPGIYQPVRNSHTNQSYLISTWYLMAFVVMVQREYKLNFDMVMFGIMVSQYIPRKVEMNRSFPLNIIISITIILIFNIVFRFNLHISV